MIQSTQRTTTGMTLSQVIESLTVPELPYGPDVAVKRALARHLRDLDIAHYTFSMEQAMSILVTRVMVAYDSFINLDLDDDSREVAWLATYKELLLTWIGCVPTVGRDEVECALLALHMSALRGEGRYAYAEQMYVYHHDVERLPEQECINELRKMVLTDLKRGTSKYSLTYKENVQALEAGFDALRILLGYTRLTSIKETE